MPGRDEHLRIVGRFEAFLQQINTPTQPYREWVVIVWFHVALHYVDAFLATKGHEEIEGHSGRWAKLPNYDETRPLAETFHRLYKEAKEARYEGADFAPPDLAAVERLYVKVRGAMRTALGHQP